MSGEAIVSASGLDRAITCLASLVLPREKQTDTVYSEAGTRKHAALEVATLGARMEDIRARAGDAVSDAELVCLLESWAALRANERLQPIAGFPSVEVAMALDPVKQESRVLGAGLGRKYVCEETELPGTSDYFYIRDGVLTVVDLKSGSPKHGKQPDETWQMRVLGLALWLWHGRPPAGCNLWLWYPREGETWDPVMACARPGTEPRKFHARPELLEAWLEALAAWVPLAIQVKAGLVAAKPVKSKECHWCACKKSCPLQRR